MSSAPSGLTASAYLVEAHRDCYEQIHWSNLGEANPVRDRLIPRLQAGGVDLVVYAVGGDTLAHSNGRDKKLLATIENIESLAAYLSEVEDAVIVRTGSEIPAEPDGRIRFLLHLEGGMPLEGSVLALDALFELGVRSVQPTWNVRNELGDGVQERDTRSGLTRFGVQVVQRMQQRGIIVDLAHMPETTFWHTMEVTEGVVIVSHANSRAIYDHPRNLTDEQVKAVAGRGGVVGVHTLPTFVGPGQPGLSDLVQHVQHLVDVAGAEHVGFGGDFVARDGPRPGREQLFHDPRVEPPTIPGLSEAHELPHLTDALLDAGLDEETVVAILGDNFRRVYQQVLPD